MSFINYQHDPDAPEKQLTVSPLEKGARTELVALQTVFKIIVSEGCSSRVKFGKSVIRTYPEISIVIREDAMDRIIL